MVLFKDYIKLGISDTDFLTCHLNGDFLVLQAANGGFLMALLLASLKTVGSKNGDCLSLQCAFLHSCKPGPVQIRVHLEKKGRELSWYTCCIFQNERKCLLGTAVFGRLATENAIRGNFDSCIDSCVVFKPPERPFWQRYQFKFSETDLATWKHMSGVEKLPHPPVPSLSIFMAHEDEEYVTEESMLAFCDAAIPLVKAATEFGDMSWVPSLFFDVKFHAKPKDLLWVLCILNLKTNDGKYVTEECNIYDPNSKQLLCTTTQHGLRTKL